MKKFFRWFFIAFGSLVVFLIMASGVAWYYKPELTRAIHEKIRENINGEFNIDDISVSVLDDFPQVSVTLEGIYLRGLQYKTYSKDFLRAEKVQVNVHLGKLFLKEIDVKSIRIEDGNVFVFRTKSGYSNLDIFKKNNGKKAAGADSASQSSTAILNIHRIYFSNVSIAYHDSLKGKAFGVRFVEGKNDVVNTDSSRQFHFKGKIDFDRLQFNEAKGSYLLSRSTESELNGEFIPASKRLLVFPSVLSFEKSSVGLSGAFQFLPKGTFRLDIDSDNMIFREGESLLPRSLGAKLARYDISNAFKLKVAIDGSLEPGADPKIDINFETHDATIKIDTREAAHADVVGTFTNHRDSLKETGDPNSAFDIKSFKGVIYGFPVTASALIRNLRDPFLTTSLSVQASSNLLSAQLDTAVFKMPHGQLLTNISYKGKLNDLADPVGCMNLGTLTGSASLQNAELVWVPRKLTVKNVNAAVAITRQKFDVNNFTFTIDGSPVAMNGRIDGFLDLITHPEKRAYVRLKVSSPDLNTTNLFPDTENVEEVQNQPQKNKPISEMIDKLYKRLEFDLTLAIQNYKHKNFKATGIAGTILLRNNELLADPLRMKVAGGDVELTFGLSELNKPNNPLWIQARVHRADIRQFFFGFNNFKQKTIDSKNLSGKINANVGFSAMLDDDFNLLMPSLSGKVDLTVKDGKLTNFAPLEKMSNFLFKHRDFSEIQFAEIQSTFDMRGTELYISRMEVESTVMSMFIEGRFSLADSTDLTIQLPLSNLKRRDKDYKPTNVGTDSKVGPSVFLRARPDEKGVMSIAYDPFRKFRKKKL